VLVQNTGSATWHVNPLDELSQTCLPSNGSEQDYETLLAHHVYHQGGGQACTNCIGLMWVPFCREETYQYNPVEPGEAFWLNGFRFFLPNKTSIIAGETFNT
jgi:hypothetical protein